MKMAKKSRTVMEITVVGSDQKGVVVQITGALFRSGGNIEQVSQNVVRGVFGMHLEASFDQVSRHDLDDELQKLAGALAMEVRVHYIEPHRQKNLAVLVTKEPHCLQKILEARKAGELAGNLAVVIGSDAALGPLVASEGLPFFMVPHEDQVQAERRMLDLFDVHNIDLIVLARYMRVLTPSFVFRYPNRIINIHPSLLPAFQGAYAYIQAYERGAKIVGCTAHFVTEDLDQGPIICQESFKVAPDDTLQTIRRKGRELEAVTLFEAVQLFLQDRLENYWGRVHVTA